MPLSTILIGVPFMVAFAFFGRWLQLHTERIVSKGCFAGPNTFLARMFRVQVAFVGTFAVFGGTWGAVFGVLSAFTFNSIVLGWTAQVIGLSVGIYAAIRVRKQVRVRPESGTSIYGGP